MLEQIDWPTAGAAVGAILATAYTIYRGWRDEKKSKGSEPTTQILAASIQDNTSIRENTEQLRRVEMELRRFNDCAGDLVDQMRLNQAAFTRFTDILVMRKR